jgi:hypothetical protein
MPGPAAALELTASEVHKLTALVRAGTTPQRLVRRARVILGSAAGNWFAARSAYCDGSLATRQTLT